MILFSVELSVKLELSASDKWPNIKPFSEKGQ